MKNKILFIDPEEKSEETFVPFTGVNRLGIDSLSMDELVRSNKELEQFAFLSAHDLKEPLSVTYAYAQLLQINCRGKLDNNADKIISLILESTERMQELIERLLQYSRAGKGNIQWKELDCSVLLSRVIENLQVSIEKNSAQIRFESCPIIAGDEIQMTQLFQNLINNAIKFHKKEVAPTINISAQEQDEQWFFSIQDNGIGVETEYTQKIFEIFRRVHAQSEYEGSGIGLALCKRIVESHGGTIWIESKLGEGTAVRFTIPKIKEPFTASL